jgi:transcriptional regulator with XRE-family HTH domain
MWVNLGSALSLLRELRGKSQARLAREAGIGKSQLSKYETGKEMPKLDSLEKVLHALEVGQYEFFYTLYLVDCRAGDLRRADREAALAPGDSPALASLASAGTPAGKKGDLGDPRLPPLMRGETLLGGIADPAFARLFNDVLALYRGLFEQALFQPARTRKVARGLKVPR